MSFHRFFSLFLCFSASPRYFFPLRLCILCVFALLFFRRAHAQTPERPLIPPFQQPPGVNSWLFGQPYGNTTGAFNFGTEWYSAGQGLHFGLDFSAPCGTPLVATADGIVVAVDNFAFGSRPHNLLIRHDAPGLVSLYGHLLDTPDLVVGQFVTQGQFVGYSGTPDSTCDSRPHVHYELRSLDYRTAYNPIPYMDANWHSLASIGSFGNELFQMNLDNARQWMSLDDQPNVAFGGGRLNAYANSYPPANGLRPPPNPPLHLELPALTAVPTVELKRIGYDECCPDYTWHPTRPETLYTVDGAPGQRAVIFEWSAGTGSPLTSDGVAPFKQLSPDGTLEVLNTGGQVQIRRLSDGVVWAVPVPANTNLPGISADNSRLMWWQRSAATIPGQEQPDSALFVSDIDGQNARQIANEPGTSAQWLDGSRLLVAVNQRPNTRLDVYDTATDVRYNLGTWYRLRGLTVAPGGGRIMFYLPNQPNPDDSGVYVMATQPGAVPQKLPWFGGWRWRDANSVYFIPFNPASEIQQLAYYNIPSGTMLLLTNPETQPFTMMNGKWEVSADGRYIAFHNLVDRNLWLMTVGS